MPDHDFTGYQCLLRAVDTDSPLWGHAPITSVYHSTTRTTTSPWLPSEERYEAEDSMPKVGMDIFWGNFARWFDGLLVEMVPPDALTYEEICGPCLDDGWNRLPVGSLIVRTTTPRNGNSILHLSIASNKKFSGIAMAVSSDFPDFRQAILEWLPLGNRQRLLKLAAGYAEAARGMCSGELKDAPAGEVPAEAVNLAEAAMHARHEADLIKEEDGPPDEEALSALEFLLRSDGLQRMLKLRQGKQGLNLLCFIAETIREISRPDSRYGLEAVESDT